MRSKALWMAVALLAVQPALASPFAMLPPSFAKGHDKAGQDAGRAIIDRARLALKRPPAPIPVIHVEGTLPGQGIYDISDTALQDLPVALDLALAWRLTREKPFLTQAEAYIAAWAQVYKVSRNPIDETGLDALIAAYDLTGKKLSPRTRKQFDGFLRTVASGYLSDIETGNVWIYTKINNWQSHRVKLATLAAFSLGDAKLIDRAHRAFEKQVAANLRPDGSAQDFETRDALHYVVYTLEPLLVAAYAAKIHGQDWYGFHTNEGAGLQKSLDWLAQYARGEKTHIEFVKSVVAFDRQRAEAGVGTFKNQAWNPMESAQVYALASLFDPRFAGLRDTLMAKGGTVSPWIRLANRHSR